MALHTHICALPDPQPFCPSTTPVGTNSTCLHKTGHRSHLSNIFWPILFADRPPYILKVTISRSWTLMASTDLCDTSTRFKPPPGNCHTREPVRAPPGELSTRCQSVYIGSCPDPQNWPTCQTVSHGGGWLPGPPWRRVDLLVGWGSLLDGHTVAVRNERCWSEEPPNTVTGERVVLAVGSRPAVPAPWPAQRDGGSPHALKW